MKLALGQGPTAGDAGAASAAGAAAAPHAEGLRALACAREVWAWSGRLGDLGGGSGEAKPSVCLWAVAVFTAGVLWGGA